MATGPQKQARTDAVKKRRADSSHEQVRADDDARRMDIEEQIRTAEIE